MTAWSDLARLGHHVVSGRVTLGYRNRTELANSPPFTVRTLADVEQGVRTASRAPTRHAGEQIDLGTVPAGQYARPKEMTWSVHSS